MDLEALLNDKVQIAFQIGNYYKKSNQKGVGNNFTGKWTSFVRIKETSQKHLIAALVEKIEFQYRSEVHVRKPNSENDEVCEEVWHTNNNGWGNHIGIVDIHFKPELGFEKFGLPFFTTIHQIQLDGIGKWNTIFISFDKKKFDRVLEARNEEIKNFSKIDKPLFIRKVFKNLATINYNKY